jgi:hypothetical protein
VAVIVALFRVASIRFRMRNTIAEVLDDARALFDRRDRVHAATVNLRVARLDER